MEQFSCIAIDDEDLAIRLLEDFVSRVSNVAWISGFDDAEGGAQFLKQNHVDILLLDIHMPRKGGLELLASLPNRPVTIITTSHAQYALKGYELDVVDYLLKPFTFERFHHAMEKAVLYVEAQAGKTDSDCIWVQADYQAVRVEYEEIGFIEACKQYIKIYTNSEMILTLNSLKAMEELLPKDQFIRIHKSYIVCKSKISKKTAAHVVIHGRKIPIGRAYRQNLG